MGRLIVALTLLVVSQMASGRTPGCDTCLQVKIISATAQIKSSLASLQSTAQSNVASTDAVNTTIDNANQSLNMLLDTQHQLLLAGLDAHSAKMTLTNQALAETVSASADVISSNIYQAIYDTQIAESASHNAALYGPLGRPMSSDVFANRALPLKEAYVEYQTRLKEELLRFNEWAYMVPENDMLQRIREIEVDERLESLRPVLPKLADSLISGEDVTKVIEIYRLTLLPTPIDISSLSQADELAYHRKVTKAKTAFEALVADVLRKAPLLSTEGWVIGYVHVKEIEGQTSIAEFERAETYIKMLSADWQFDIQKINNFGLLREHINQTDMSNYLIMQLIEEERRTLALLANDDS